MGAMLEQGGGHHSPYSKTGGEAPRLPGTPSLSVLPLSYDGTQSRPLESGPRCNTSRLSEATFGGNGAELLQCGGWAGEPLVACQNKGNAIPD